MNKQMLKELAEMGVIVIPLDDPQLLHDTLKEILGEEDRLDQIEHARNKEWCNG